MILHICIRMATPHKTENKFIPYNYMSNSINIGVDADISDQLFMWLNPKKYLNGYGEEHLEDYMEQSPNLEVEYIDNTHKHYKGDCPRFARPIVPHKCLCHRIKHISSAKTHKISHKIAKCV